jgi:hypothetical protein
MARWSSLQLFLLIGCLNLIGLLFISFNTPHLRSLEPPPQSVSLPLVGVVIRAHEGYKHHLLSLLWGLHSQTSQCNLKIVVVPTEAPSIPILTQFLHDHWFADKTAEKDLDLSLVTISSDIFLSHCCHLEQLCTKEWQTNKLSEGYSTSALQRYCEVNSPLHYHLTDLGLETIHPNRKEEDLMRSSILQSASTFLIMPSPISTPEPCFFGDITPSACYS